MSNDRIVSSDYGEHRCRIGPPSADLYDSGLPSTLMALSENHFSRSTSNRRSGLPVFGPIRECDTQSSTVERALVTEREQENYDSRCDLGIVPLYPQRLVRRPSSIIRDACDLSLLPPVEDIPSKGGPADREFEPYPTGP